MKISKSNRIDILKNQRHLYDPVILLAKQYYQVTGVFVRVFDSSIKEIFRVDHPSWRCQVCSSVDKKRNLTTPPKNDFKKSCTANYIFNAVRSRYFGGHRVYQCQSGFTFWSSPIIVNGSFFASIVAGSMALAEEKEAFRGDRILTPQNRLSNSLSLFNAEKEHVIQSRITALAEILHLSCSALSQKYFLSYSKNDDYENFNEQSHFLFYEELVFFVEKHNVSSANLLVNKIFQKIVHSTQGDFLIIKEKILDLVLFVLRVTQNHNNFLINTELLKTLQEITDLNTLLQWFMNIIEILCAMPNNKAFKSFKNNNILIRSVYYMHQNFALNITLEEVSQFVGLSPSYFSRFFKTEMSINFTEYLNKIRINYSKYKLIYTKLSLSEIADLSGFSDQSYFTKIFKRLEGVSPSVYRRTNSS